MSDAVTVALITSACNIAAVVIGRLLSHEEHKETAKKVVEIRDIVRNGNGPKSDQIVE